MATGTGLPALSGGGPVLAQAPGGASGDALFNADSWNRIAAAGEHLASAGGDYLKVAEHKAQVGYLSDQDVEIQRKQIELRNQHAYDPQKFDNEWTAYSEGKLAGAQPWAVPHIRSSLGSKGNAAYSAVLNETRVKAETDAKNSWSVLEDQASNDVLSSAMAGTLATPEGQAKIHKYRGVVGSGVTSEFIPKEEADRRIGTLESAATVYASRTGVKGTFDAEGPVAATKHIDDITRDEKLRLTPEQRFSLGARLRADVHGWDAERRQNVDAVDVEAKALLVARQGGVALPQSRVDEVVERYKKFGGQAQAASFLADIQHSQELSFLSRVPASEAAAWVDRYKTDRGFNSPPQAAKTAVDYFVSQGWTPAQAQGIVGNLIHESGLNPNAVHDNGTGLGVAGHRLERLDAMRAFAASRGKPVNDFQTQLEFINQELNSTESSAGLRLRNASSPEAAAAAFIHFERPQGYDPANIAASHGYQSRVNNAMRLAAATPSPSLTAADAATLNLTPQEKDLYSRHFTNLYGPGGVTNPPTAQNPHESRSTIYQTTVDHDGKVFSIPTVWDGKILSVEESVKRVAAEGWNKFPSYASVAEASARYQQIHGFMDKDTATYFDRKANPPKLPPPATASDTAFIGKANLTVAKRIDDAAEQIVKDMNDKANPILPSEQRINELLTAAAATNMPEVLEKVSKAAGEYQFRRNFGRAPESHETAIVNELSLKAHTEGLSETDARRLTIATDVRDRTAKALADDPLNHTIGALADSATTPPPTVLNVADPGQFRAGLQLRSQWADMGTRTFETAPMPALTNAEVTRVRAALDAADPAGKARIYSDIVASTTGATRSATLAKLGAKGVDGMVEAYAGAMAGLDPAIGESIIRGQGAMKANERFNPDKSKSDVDGALEKYLPGSAFTLAARTDPQGAYAVMRGAVMARAADLAATDPGFKGDFTDSMIQRAVNDVTGGVVVHNGASLIAPARGITQRGFDQKMAGLTDADLQGVATQSGTPVTAEYVRSNAQLESLSDGRYLVRLGRDPERPVYAFRDLGVMGQPMRPFVLDLRLIKPSTTLYDPLSLANALP